MEIKEIYEAPELTVTELDSGDVLNSSIGEVENIPWSW